MSSSYKQDSTIPLAIVRKT